MSAALYAARTYPEKPDDHCRLIDCSPFPMAELEGAQHIVRQANSKFCQLMGVKADSMVGRPYAEVVPDRSSLVALDRVYRSGSCELHGKQDDIQALPEDWSYSVWPVLGATNRPDSVIIQVTGPTLLQRARAMNEALLVSVVHEHESREAAETANVRLEAEIEERKRAEAALAKSEARFRALVAMSSDWYWEQDEEFRFTELNEPTGKEASFSPADYLGKTRWEIPSLGITEEQWGAHRELLRQHKPFRGLEYQRKNASGNKIWVSVNGDPIFDSAGVFRGYRGTGRDISERKQHQEQLELIMREVAHREKNVLSLVIAVARQTAVATPEYFLERFRNACARSLQIVTVAPIPPSGSSRDRAS